MQFIKSKPVSISQISMLLQYQLKEPIIKANLDLSDESEVYDNLKRLSDSQYHFLNRLMIEKNWKKIIMIFNQIGIKPYVKQ